MNVQIYLLLLTASVALVMGACNFRLDQRRSNDFEMHKLHASKETFEAQNMTLVFDYQVSPTDTAEITMVEMSTPMESNCIAYIAADIPLKTGFKVTLVTTIPVQSFSGSATIYGIRRGN